MGKRVLIFMILLHVGCSSAKTDPERDSCQPGATQPVTRTNTTAYVKSLRDEMRAADIFCSDSSYSR
ncbi:hypothetical protein EB796_014423 [Bugula neritina]|uniref:Uncharacterized protein n=1 Tax=Bugula neritina TaxID=10212 RepID=A0A7J7JNT7_BUGNE|nr:hypothetical protein EB796_014423 [Bugula neritina]